MGTAPALAAFSAASLQGFSVSLKSCFFLV